MARKETVIESVEITFSNGLHIRLLAKQQQATCWQEHNGDIYNIQKVSLNQLIEDLSERKKRGIK